MKIRVQLAPGSSDTREFAPGTVTIGREPDNAIVPADSSETRVSRYHAELRFASGSWRIVDSKSANGTYLNGRRITDAVLSDGDEIRLAAQGPRLTVSLPAGRASRPLDKRDELRVTDIQPWRIGAQSLAVKGYLPHALITVLTVLAIRTTSVYSPDGELLADGALNSFRILLFYIAAASTYAVYRLCGKIKPWWLLLAAAAATFGLVLVVHPRIMPTLLALGSALGACSGEAAEAGKCDNVVRVAIYWVFRAAIPEELIKIAPVVGLWYATQRMRNRGENEQSLSHYGIVEPLDGIVIAFASAAGFTALEGFQYVSGVVGRLSEAGHPDIGLAIGFSQMVTRSIGHLFGHGAYSGIFGYYVGLAALRPANARQLLLSGLGLSVLLHTAWNTANAASPVSFLLMAVGYVILISCIVHARTISPTRSENFATQLKSEVKVPS